MNMQLQFLRLAFCIQVNISFNFSPFFQLIFLQTTMGKIVMKIGRLKTGIRLSHSGENASSVNKSDESSESE